MSLKEIEDYYANLKRAKKLTVAVGLVKGKATGRVYSSGKNVVEIGTIHEFGKGNNPQRSFLRTPFIVKRGDIAHAIRRQFKLIVEQGKDAEKALKTVGIEAENISKDAFVTGGFGQWSALETATINAKRSKSPRTKKSATPSQILIDKGILRSSITSEVR